MIKNKQKETPSTGFEDKIVFMCLLVCKTWLVYNTKVNFLSLLM